MRPQSMYVSATPSRWEMERAGGVFTEQVIRPTGLIDPPVEIRPAKAQVDDLLGEVRAVAARGEIDLERAPQRRERPALAARAELLERARSAVARPAQLLAGGQQRGVVGEVAGGGIAVEGRVAHVILPPVRIVRS